MGYQLDHLARASLAEEVYDAIFRGVETFEPDHIGEDLAYLMGAILKDGKVEWNKRYNGAPRPIVTILLTELTDTHVVWQFVDLVGPS